jgi:hypothetical protein
MKKITVNNIQDNMIISRDVCGTNGNVLIAKGTILSSALGRRLENWGITTVYIEGEEEIIPETTTIIESPEKSQQLLFDKFSKVIDNPYMKKILNAVNEFRFNNNK